MWEQYKTTQDEQLVVDSYRIGTSSECPAEFTQTTPRSITTQSHVTIHHYSHCGALTLDTRSNQFYVSLTFKTFLLTVHVAIPRDCICTWCSCADHEKPGSDIIGVIRVQPSRVSNHINPDRSRYSFHQPTVINRICEWCVRKSTNMRCFTIKGS